MLCKPCSLCCCRSCRHRHHCHSHYPVAPHQYITTLNVIFHREKKIAEKNGFADYYCHLQLLPLLLLLSFNPASQPAQELSIDSFKWCGIVVWLGDSHSGTFISFVRSFIHPFFGGFFLRSFLQMPLYLMSIVSNLPLSLRICWAKYVLVVVEL